MRTERDPAAWHWRLRRRPGVLAAIVGGAALLAGAALWGPEAPGDHDPGEPLWSGIARGAGDGVVADAPDQEGAVPDPEAAARDLTGMRVDALAHADGEALLALTVPGSPAWATAAREARMITEGTRLDGVRVDLGESRTLGVDDGEAVVAVAYALGRHVRVDADGTRTIMPAQSQRALLTLAWSGEEWRVSAVAAAPDEENEDEALSGTP